MNKKVRKRSIIVLFLLIVGMGIRLDGNETNGYKIFAGIDYSPSIHYVGSSLFQESTATIKGTGYEANTLRKTPEKEASFLPLGFGLTFGYIFNFYDLNVIVSLSYGFNKGKGNNDFVNYALLSHRINGDMNIAYSVYKNKMFSISPYVGIGAGINLYDISLNYSVVFAGDKESKIIHETKKNVTYLPLNFGIISNFGNNIIKIGLKINLITFKLGLEDIKAQKIYKVSSEISDNILLVSYGMKF